MHRIATDAAQLRHAIGHHEALSPIDLVRLARKHEGVRARYRTARWADLAKIPLPALARGADGWFILGRVAGDDALVQYPGAEIAKIARPTLEADWTGDLVLITTREDVGGSTRAFDLSWFVPQIAKYRRLIGEVLLITLAINLLGLAAPLFFQNIVDKVLVHNTLSTLTVLAIGFVVVSLWETAFGWLRTRLYSETSQKIDVELGSKLFWHMLRLPLGYFEARRVALNRFKSTSLRLIAFISVTKMVGKQ